MVWLGWYTPQHGWRALDLKELNTRSYDDNDRATTLRLAQVIDMRKEILERIDKRGVFIEPGQSALALDFERARQEFGIWGLP